MLFSSNLMQRTAIHRQCMRLPSSPRESRKRNKGNKSNTTIQGAQRSPVSYMYSSVTLEADAFDLIRVFLFVQVSRSIGDAYLKRTEFNKEPLLSKFRLPKPFYEPILRPEPEISVHRIRPEDKFVIFASDGLWECLSNREAVNIVRSSPRRGIAKRLVEAALKEAAKRREIRHTDLLKIEQGVRRQSHDDITVVVVFIDSRSDNGDSPKNCSVSV